MLLLVDLRIVKVQYADLVVTLVAISTAVWVRPTNKKHYTARVDLID